MSDKFRYPNEGEFNDAAYDQAMEYLRLAQIADPDGVTASDIKERFQDGARWAYRYMIKITEPLESTLDGIETLALGYRDGGHIHAGLQVYEDIKRVLNQTNTKPDMPQYLLDVLEEAGQTKPAPSYSELLNERDALEYKLSCLLCHATGGLWSKASYSIDEMRSQVDDHIETMIENALKETES